MSLVSVHLIRFFLSVFSALPSSPIEVEVHCFYLLQKISLQIKVLGKQNPKKKEKKKIRSTKTLDAEKKKKIDQFVWGGGGRTRV